MAPITLELVSVKRSNSEIKSPTHNSGKVRLSGNNCLSRSIRANATSVQVNISAAKVSNETPYFMATAIDSAAVNDSITGYRIDIGIAQDEHFPLRNR